MLADLRALGWEEAQIEAAATPVRAALAATSGELALLEEERRRKRSAQRTRDAAGRRDIFKEKGWNTMESSFGGPGRMKWWAEGGHQGGDDAAGPAADPAADRDAARSSLADGGWDESESGFVSWL